MHALLCAVVLAASQDAAPWPRPEGEALAAAQAKVQEVFHAELAVRRQLRSPTPRTRQAAAKKAEDLTEKLLDLAKKTQDDPPATYALLLLARDLAIETRAHDLGLEAVRQIAARFRPGSLEPSDPDAQFQRAETLWRDAGKGKSPGAVRARFEAAEWLVRAENGANEEQKKAIQERLVDLLAEGDLLRGAYVIATFDKGTVVSGPDGLAMVKDLSGQQNHLIAHHARIVPGQAGMALFFDGQGYLSLRGSEKFNPKTFTIACWVQATEWKGNDRDYLISKDDWQNDAAKGFVLRCKAGRPQVMIGADRWYEAIGQNALPCAEWHHLAATFDVACLKLYVDGALTHTQAVGTILTRSISELRLANGHFDPNRGFMGSLDEVAVLTRPLTEAEILAVWRCGYRRQSLR